MELSRETIYDIVQMSVADSVGAEICSAAPGGKVTRHVAADVHKVPLILLPYLVALPCPSPSWLLPLGPPYYLSLAINRSLTWFSPWVSLLGLCLGRRSGMATFPL